MTIRTTARPLLVLLLAVLVAGCSGGGVPPGPGNPSGSAVVVGFAPTGGAVSVRPDALVRVAATSGRLTAVDVRPQGGAAAVPGALSADGSSWTAQAGVLLQLDTEYVVEAHAVDADGRGRSVRSTFTTLRPKGVLNTVITPGNGALVGVGMPLMVKFTQKVADRAAVERALSVEMSKPVEGSWRWFSSQEIHFRPRTYWPAGEHVSVTFHLAGVDAGGGVWGDHDRSFSFDVAPSALVSTVDITAHTMTVTKNGSVLRVIPITTGKDGYLTRGGTKVIISKERTRLMDSTTVDIPPGSPDAYHLTVAYALRLTWSGEFVHAAPWSVAHQGHENVSHGCTGMSTANAAWFYSISRIGDVVRYVHSTRPLEPGNGYTDWNLSWAAWTAGSAVG
ncbi:MAG: Ig-like domain-containing protein [Actinomycetes bacterium]